jgi:UDP-glucose 4-epimerase
MPQSSKNILVTGGAGYIGSHIVEQLIKNKENVIILDNLVTGYKKLINKKAKFVKADIHIKELKYLKDNKKSFVLNCGYGKGYSVKQIVDIFKKIKKGVDVQYQKRRPGDIAQVYANTKKFQKILKWRPKYNNIKLIIQSAIKWEKKLKN